MRRVISLYLPRFATDRQGRAEPPHKARTARGPFALVLEARARRLLYAVDAAGARLGLRPGMALSDARAMVPGLRTAPVRPQEDKRALAALAGWCGRYSPWTSAEADPADGEPAAGDPAARAIEQGGAAGLWLDVTGCVHLFGGEPAMLDDLVKRIERIGFSARAAIADTPGCAWAVARYTSGPGPVVVPPGKTRDALAPLPVAALRLAPADAVTLHGLGLRRIGDLYDLPRAPLTARLGAGVTKRLDAALGLASEPISPTLPRIAHHAHRAFPEPIGRIEDIAAALTLLCGDLCAGLARAGEGARRLALTLYRPDGTLARVAVGTARASRDPAHLDRLFARHLDGIDPGFGIEDMVLSALVTEKLDAAQLGLARKREGGDSATDGVDALIDRLGNRLGAANVLRPRGRESHWPERTAFFASAFETAHAGAAACAMPPGACPRPPRLLRPPEAIEAIAAPDGPPARFRWRRVLHRVVHAEGPERIAPEWWRDDGDHPTRDYYRVEDSEGRRFWIYRTEAAGRAPAWYVHGVFG